MDRFPLRVLLPKLADRSAITNHEESLSERLQYLRDSDAIMDSTAELELEMLEVAAHWSEKLFQND